MMTVETETERLDRVARLARRALTEVHGEAGGDVVFVAAAATQALARILALAEGRAG